MLELNKIYCGDCLDVMKEMPENSIDSILTDPPYGLKFMGKEWDHGIPGIPFWQEVMRISKPGAHMLAFGGTRTHHRLMVAIEDAGWEIRDVMMWVHSQGFPKSLNVSKAIDKAAGVERKVIGVREDFKPGNRKKVNQFNCINPSLHGYNTTEFTANKGQITISTTNEAKQWDGWGSALKPAYEPIVLCRKPLEGTIAANVLKWGVGGINIDGCRIATNELTPRNNKMGDNGWKNSSGGFIEPSPLGRFPANFIHDGSQTVLDMFPYNKSTKSLRGCGGGGDKISQLNYRENSIRGHNDNGSAARFFYCAKASKAERDIGCENLPENDIVTFQTCNGTSGKPGSLSEGRETKYRNNHPTVKPIALLTYLCRLITPPNGVILDPFAGSGSTGIAAIKEGFNYILIEKEQQYVDISNARLKGVL